MEKINLGHKLKKFRKLRGYTQEDVAKKINKSVEMYKRYEYETSYPPVEVLMEIIEFLNVTPDDLLLDENKKLNDNEILEDIKRLENDEQETVKKVIKAMSLYQKSREIINN